MQIAERILIHRLADMSAFVVFNRLNWQTYIVDYQQLVESLHKSTIKNISAENFVTLTAQQQIDILFEEGYWDAYS